MSKYVEGEFFVARGVRVPFREILSADVKLTEAGEILRALALAGALISVGVVVFGFYTSAPVVLIGVLFFSVSGIFIKGVLRVCASLKIVTHSGIHVVKAPFDELKIMADVIQTVRQSQGSTV